jgi:F-type H+-transporting ATPase subunit delta
LKRVGSAVGRNYAEALFELALTAGEGRLEEYGRLIDATARVLESSPEIEAVLMNPKITKPLKARVLGLALAQVGAPRPFVLFCEAVVKRGRQLFFGAIADEYAARVDQSMNRVRAAVTVSRKPAAALEAEIARALTTLLGKEVIPTYTVDPAILGGAVVRVGDRVFDGSLRRKLVRLRRQLLAR